MGIATDRRVTAGTRNRTLAAATGVAYALTAAVDFAHVQPTVFTSVTDYVLEALFTAALVFSALTAGSLARTSSGVSRVGWGIVAAGSALLACVTGATLVGGRETLDTVFPIALLGILVGYLVLGVADVLKKVRPRFVGIALLLSGVAMLALGENSGVLALAAGWFASAALLGPAPDSDRRDRQ